MLLSRRFERALAFAARLHARQRRKGTTIPYVAHLLGVASIALEHGANEDEAIAALLHDAVEDQGGAPTLERIRRRFGNRVADIVDGCTGPKAPTFRKPRAGGDDRDRSQDPGGVRPLSHRESWGPPGGRPEAGGHILGHTGGVCA